MKKFVIGLLIFGGIFIGNSYISVGGVVEAADDSSFGWEDVTSGMNTAAGAMNDFSKGIGKGMAGAAAAGSGGGSGSSTQKVYTGPTFRGVGLTGGAVVTESLLDSGISKEHNLKKVIVGWTNWLLPLAAVLAVVGIVWAGFLYITAFGDDGKMDTAKNIIIWVVVGILVILSAYAIVNTVMKATHEADNVKFSTPGTKVEAQ